MTAPTQADAMAYINGLLARKNDSPLSIAEFKALKAIRAYIEGQADKPEQSPKPLNDAQTGSLNEQAEPADAQGRDIPSDYKYKFGEFVRKKGDKGQWHGKVVGFYSTECTPRGYAVESVYEANSVQIYPESALEPWQPPQESVDVEKNDE